MKAPFQGFPPELLAQIAERAFRPPQAMGMQAPGLPGMGGMDGGDGGMSAGMAGLGMGLRHLWPQVGRTPNGDPNDNRPYMIGGVDPRLIDPLTGLPRTGILGPI